MARRIGEVLVERGLVQSADVELALEAAKGSGGRLASQLLSLGLCEESTLVEVLSGQLGVPGVDLSRSAFPLANLALIPREIAEQEHILPLAVQADQLLLAMADPQQARVLEEVRLISGLSVLPHVAVESRLLEVLAAAYTAQERGRSMWVGESLPKEQAAAALEVRAPPAPPSGDVDIEIELDDSSGTGTEEELARVSARPGPRIVLAVDDEEQILKLVTRALEKEGLKVERASRGKEALKRVAELMPDLVLLDANLPEIHGFDIARQLKTNPRFARIPIIVMTAVYRGWRYAQDTREALGIDDYIEKPFRLEDLVRRVNHHLAKSIGEPAGGRDKAEALYAEGTAHLEAGRVHEAVAAFEEAHGLAPFDPKMSFQLGRALHMAGDSYKAIAMFEHTVDVRPDHFPALKALAALYQQKGFRRKAVEAWERAIPAAPDEATRQKIKANLLSLL